MHVFGILFIILFSHKTLADVNTIKLGYPEFKPFTYTEHGVPNGIGVQSLLKISKVLNINLVFEPIDSYGNGIKFLQNGKIDGLFLATQNSSRDKLAEFSDSITFNNWVWVSRKDKVIEYKSQKAKKRTRITTYKNANTHVWLSKNNYQLIYPTTDISAMIRQLLHNRVDAIFLAEEVFNMSLKESQWQKSDVNTTIEVTKPMGVYVSKVFLEKHPGFMTLLNEQIVKLKK